MGIKLTWYDSDKVSFHCPGCGYQHPVRVKATAEPVWKWNQSMEEPTFWPSIMVNRDDPASRCHSFVVNGKIQFLKDSYHNLKGQTVEIPDAED
jgi:hypothetical protein